MVSGHAWRATRIAWAALAVALSPILPVSAHAATQRHAAPGGSGAGCSAGSPCSIHTAVENALPGDEVIVQPGDYDVSSPIDALVQLDLHGVDGQPRPRLVGPASLVGSVLSVSGLGTGTTMRHLHVEHAGVGPAIHAGGTTVSSDLIVHHSGENATAFLSDITANAVLRDSVVRATGSGGTAAVFGRGNLQLRNVTAMAPSLDGSAVYALGSCIFDPLPPMLCLTNHPGIVTAKNVIARGGQRDLFATSMYPTAPATINVSHSSYRTEKALADGPGGSVNSQGNNLSAQPLFADEAGGDFHQLAGSPTIDAGTADPLNGPTDPDGDQRAVGAAPDIGADEFVPSAGGGGPDGGGGDATGPRARDLAIKPKRFRVRGKGASIVARKPRGATVRYTLSEVARMTFTVERVSAGRKTKGKCVRQKRSNRKRRKCTRRVVLKGSFEHQGVAGANSFRFTGRLLKKKLKPGSYRLVGTPTDAAGNVGTAARAKFRIVK